MIIENLYSEVNDLLHRIFFELSKLKADLKHRFRNFYCRSFHKVRSDQKQKGYMSLAFNGNSLLQRIKVIKISEVRKYDRYSKMV